MSRLEEIEARHANTDGWGGQGIGRRAEDDESVEWLIAEVKRLQAENERLMSRGIEGMHARIADLTALLLELSGHPGAPAWLRGRIDSFMAETPR